MSFARGAALTAATRHRAASSVLCHGLSGTLSLLAALRSQPGGAVGQHIERLLDLLGAYLVEREGQLYCHSDEPELITPELMRGMAGVLLALVYVTDPGSIDPLSLTQR